MYIERQRGMTLIELIMAIVILAVGLAGVLIVYQRTAVSSADPLVRKQMLAVAEGMMAEILRMPFAGPIGKAGAKGCARNTFSRLSDYHEYKSTGICNVLGDQQPNLQDYSITVTVESPTGPHPLIPIAAADVLTIKVKVSHGGEALTLESWRSNYGAQQPAQ